jgi:hypothetical protein
MERWKTRARRWEFKAAQRRLERRRRTGESTPGTISDDEAFAAERGSEPRAENSNDNTEIAA